MVFKSYRFQILIRLVLMVATCYAITYTWSLHKYWFTLANLIVFLIVQIYLLFRYLNRWQEDLKIFASSVRHGDFNITYNLPDKGQEHYEVYEMLNNVTRYVRDIKAEYVQQNHYFQYVVENSQVGLIAYDETGKILLINQQAGKLLGKPDLRDLHQLKGSNKEAYAQIAALELNQPRLLHISGTNSLKLSARLSKFVIDGKGVLLLSLLNIRTELEENELQSWQELISVLTHEIMNSITPIHSLNGTMAKYLDRIEGNGEVVEKAKNSLEVINRRSQSLMSFVDRYRQISTVPLPHLREVKVSDLVSSVITLMQEELQGVKLDIRPTEETINIDPSQLEQVLINILKNALSAMKNSGRREITILFERKDSEQWLMIKDSGTGIPPELLDKIFIPFFTTRKDGSGIGLTISRQIMHRHGGSIEVESTPGNGATFNLIFKK